jgi:uncharacterized protein
MLKPDVLNTIDNYLQALKSAGLEIEFAVIFGSQLTGATHQWSDIDLLVVSPQFDNMQDRSMLNILWRTTAQVDSRIEPIPCGSRQWREDDVSTIVHFARNHGEVLFAA